MPRALEQYIHNGCDTAIDLPRQGRDSLSLARDDRLGYRYRFFS
jgi:hypothetical protein